MPSRSALDTATVDGREISVAPLKTIDYARLAAKEPAELEKLLEASRSPGFFYLDLRDDSTGPVLDDLQDAFATTQQYFNLPREVKMKQHREGQDRGYKAGGPGETLEIARDEMAQEKSALAAVLDDDSAELLERFSMRCDDALQTMLTNLSDALGLDGTHRFEKIHRQTEPSDCGILLVNGPCKSKLADVGDNQHTDTGSLTLLFCDQWSVQVELPETKRWAWIEPKPGHALVNIADTLQSRSGNRLYSCRHRVTQPVDGFQPRYFIVYYLRPEKAFISQREPTSDV